MITRTRPPMRRPRRPSSDALAKKTLVGMYDSEKKRRKEESQAALKFN